MRRGVYVTKRYREIVRPSRIRRMLNWMYSAAESRKRHGVLDWTRGGLPEWKESA